MFKGIPLNLPPYPFRLKQEDGKVFIFDELRKRYLLVTPEEWVRQHWIQYLINQKRYPKTLIQCEGGLKLNELQKRTDLLIFNRTGEKILIAEFKAPSVKITQEAFDQIARYNLIHRVPLLVVSNGLQHYYCHIDFERKSYQYIEDLPDFTV
ncbi:type I restriction enzyme HsdR N-terminal domain-containing protein [Albibacterium indicum]|uniref:type I restriction enzyme HsdR N-terminal domain-containing protein n=1 Tax=Albibacterium indicum TaxID=2292082 RepID=UPI000E4BC377|nr:type I restriction enzyme HsdR N-terminal domain-containing protein [Pedobacter indicus]